MEWRIPAVSSGKEQPLHRADLRDLRAKRVFDSDPKLRDDQEVEVKTLLLRVGPIKTRSLIMHGSPEVQNGTSWVDE